MSAPIIIVLTPVKNEEWILKYFLEITSRFADCIIIADQHSTDHSKTISNSFEKVHLIENTNQEFNEAERQEQLIDIARKLFPDRKRILMALDADELFSANSLNCSSSWEKIKSLDPGTTIFFEKPDILPGITHCVRYPENYFAIGYVDDGVQHLPKLIHSRRIPGKDSTAVKIDDIKILHFAHTRKNVQSSKLRYYSVIENIRKTNPVYLRRKMYACRYDEKKFYAKRNFEQLPNEWLKGWVQSGMDFSKFDDPEFSWYDFEVLRFFKEYGYKKFYLDNTWCINWDECRYAAIQLNCDVPPGKIQYPGWIHLTLGKMIDRFYNFYKGFNKN